MPIKRTTDSERDFLLLNSDPQSSPASVKQWMAGHDEPDAVYLHGTNPATRKEGEDRGDLVEVEVMTTAALSALAARVAGELKKRGGGALGVGERREVRGAALGLFAVCGGGDGGE